MRLFAIHLPYSVITMNHLYSLFSNAYHETYPRNATSTAGSKSEICL